MTFGYQTPAAFFEKVTLSHGLSLQYNIVCYASLLEAQDAQFCSMLMRMILNGLFASTLKIYRSTI